MIIHIQIKGALVILVNIDRNQFTTFLPVDCMILTYRTVCNKISNGSFKPNFILKWFIFSVKCKHLIYFTSVPWITLDIQFFTTLKIYKISPFNLCLFLSYNNDHDLTESLSFSYFFLHEY